MTADSTRYDSALSSATATRVVVTLPAQVRAALANTAMTDWRALAEEAGCFFLAGQHQGSTSSGFNYAAVVPGFDLAAAAQAAVPEHGLCF